MSNTPQDNPIAGVRWMEAADPGNPFGVRILNCLSVAVGMLSTTKDARVAELFTIRRRDDGQNYVGQLPKQPVEVSCNLRYSQPSNPGEGVVFCAAQMEDKWDIYLRQGRLYFVRSWTGELIAVADVRFEAAEMVVSHAITHSEHGAGPYAIQLIDFLIKSYASRIIPARKFGACKGCAFCCDLRGWRQPTLAGGQRQ